MSDFFSLYSPRLRAHRLLRAAHPGGRCRLQSRRDAEAGGRGRQGRVRPSWSFPSSACRPTPSTTCCCRTRCSTRSRRRSPRSSTASNKLFPVLIVGAPLRRRRPALQHRHRHPSRRHPGRGAQDLPAELPRVLREAPLRLRRQRHRAGHQARRPDGAVRHRPAVPLDRHASPFTFHVEICEDIWVPVPPSSHAALAGAEVLVNLSASNITIGKAETRRLLCGSQSARAIAAYAYSAAGPGESTTDLAWDGHAAIYECGDQLAEIGALREGLDHRPGRCRSRPHPPGAAALQRLRRLRAAGGRHGSRASARSTSSSTRRSGSVALRARRSSAFPTCRPIRPSCATIATRPTTSRSRAWRSACSRAAPSKAVIGVSGGLDSTQALIVDLPGDGPARPAAQERAGLHAAGLRHLGQDPQERLAADEGAGRDGGRDRHQAGGPADAGRHRPSLRQGREGLRRHLRERAGGPAHRLSVPPRQPACAAWWSAPATCPNWGWAGAPTASAITCPTTIPTARSPRR